MCIVTAVTHFQQMYHSVLLLVQVLLLALPIGSLQPIKGLGSRQPEQGQGRHVIVAGFMPHIYQQAGQTCSMSPQKSEELRLLR